ncbi:MAG: hypothetical protein VXW41_12575, partial [SAR324 cluster bacterium]|nr:hypothetical protein [SAR324 cluster bacterium]
LGKLKKNCPEVWQLPDGACFLPRASILLGLGLFPSRKFTREERHDCMQKWSFVQESFYAFHGPYD